MQPKKTIYVLESVPFLYSSELLFGSHLSQKWFCLFYSFHLWIYGWAYSFPNLKTFLIRTFEPCLQVSHTVMLLAWCHGYLRTELHWNLLLEWVVSIGFCSLICICKSLRSASYHWITPVGEKTLVEVVTSTMLCIHTMRVLNVRGKRCLAWEQVHIQQQLCLQKIVFVGTESLDHWPLSFSRHTGSPVLFEQDLFT